MNLYFAFSLVGITIGLFFLGLAFYGTVGHVGIFAICSLVLYVAFFAIGKVSFKI